MCLFTWSRVNLSRLLVTPAGRFDFQTIQFSDTSNTRAPPLAQSLPGQLGWADLGVQGPMNLLDRSGICPSTQLGVARSHVLPSWGGAGVAIVDSFSEGSPVLFQLKLWADVGRVVPLWQNVLRSVLVPLRSPLAFGTCLTGFRVLVLWRNLAVQGLLCIDFSRTGPQSTSTPKTKNKNTSTPNLLSLGNYFQRPAGTFVHGGYTSWLTIAHDSLFLCFLYFIPKNTKQRATCSRFPTRIRSGHLCFWGKRSLDRLGLHTFPRWRPLLPPRALQTTIHF